jgi:hypothetical protein
MLTAGDIAVKETVQPACTPHLIGRRPAGGLHRSSRDQARKLAPRWSRPSRSYRDMAVMRLGQALGDCSMDGEMTGRPPGGRVGAVTIWLPKRDAGGPERGCGGPAVIPGRQAAGACGSS